MSRTVGWGGPAMLVFDLGKHEPGGRWLPCIGAGGMRASSAAGRGRQAISGRGFVAVGIMFWGDAKFSRSLEGCEKDAQDRRIMKRSSKLIGISR